MAILKVYDKKNNFLNEISVDSQKSILDQMLDKGLPILFGCFGGSCGTCLCEIISGKEHLNTSAIRPLIYKGLKENQFLPCIAKINTDAKEEDIIELKIVL